MQSINTFIFAVLFCVWLWVATLCLEFYTTTTNNRYRFKYWLIISILFAAHTFLGLLAKRLPFSMDVPTIRYLAFFAINLMLLEVMAYGTTLPRKNEVAARLLIIGINISFIVNYHVSMGVLQSLIFIYMVQHNNVGLQRKHFTITFILYALTGLAPYVRIPGLSYDGIYGHVNMISLLAGMVFSLHLAAGIYKMYKQEQISELITLRG